MALCEDAGKLFVISGSELEEDRRVVVVSAQWMTIVEEVRRPGRWEHLEKLVVDPENGWVYAINRGGDPNGDKDPSVTVLECDSGDVLGEVPVGRYPTDVAVRETDGTAFVTNFVDGTLSVISPEHEVIDTIPAGKGPSSAVYDPVLDLLFIHHTADSALWAIDGKTYSVLSVTEIGKHYGFPMDLLRLNPKTHQVWVIEPLLGGIYMFFGPQLASE